MPATECLTHSKIKKGQTMPVIEDIVKTCNKVNEDFEDYLKTIGAYSQNELKGLSESKFQALCIPYITERTIFSENKTVPELYLEQNPDIKGFEREIVEGLNNSISSVFEVKKRLSNGFVMYNFVNEKTYTVIPLVKMTNLREVCPSQFALVRIFKLREAYYMLEISNVIPSYEKENVLNFAVAKIIEQPEDLYFDNEEKFNEVKNYVQKSVADFKNFFGSDEILTTNKKIDELVELFDNYQKTGEGKSQISGLIEDVEEYKYMKVEEFSNSYNTFIQKSMGGFSSHSQTYDVGYLSDENLGIYIIPFWGTLCEIFTSENYKNIENYKECVEEFIKNDKLPPSFLDRLKSKCGKGFDERLKEIAGETQEEIIKKYKSSYLKKTIFSSVNALYCSKTFTEVIEKQ